jgi:radical SAM superfamily enzyme YgiQ (UPF0313 family)
MIFINSSPQNSLKIFQPFLPVFVPIGIGFLMATLQRKGIQSYLVDQQIEDNIEQKIENYLNKLEKPYIFGFSVVTAAFQNAIILAQKLKNEYPDCKIIFGGIHPTAMPEEVLLNKCVDYVIRGEAEHILPNLYDAIKHHSNHKEIMSLSFRNKRQIIHNERADCILNLNNLPAFPYENFSHEKYDMGFVMSSRGCPHNCTFCSNKINSMRRFRYRSADDVVQDLIMLHEKFNRKYVYFLDDNLLANKKRIIELAEKINNSKIAGKMIYNFQARGDNCDEEVLKILFDAGFKGVYFGIETASESLMKSINKGETVKQVIDAINLAKSIGYHVSANFIFGLPGETHQDRIDAIQLTKSLKLDLTKYNNATPYPGTELYSTAIKEKRLNILEGYENMNSVSTFIENPFKKLPMAYIPKGNTEKGIRHDILHGYFSFYFSFHKLKGVFTRPDLNNAWFDFGHSFVDFVKKLPSIILLLILLTIKFSGFLLQELAYRIKLLFKN